MNIDFEQTPQELYQNNILLVWIARMERLADEFPINSFVKNNSETVYDDFDADVCNDETQI